MLLAAAPALYAQLAPRTVRQVGAIMSGHRRGRMKFRTVRNLQGFVVFALDVGLAFLNGLFKRSQKAPHARALSGPGCTAIGAGTYRLRSWRPRATDQEPAEENSTSRNQRDTARRSGRTRPRIWSSS